MSGGLKILESVFEFIRTKVPKWEDDRFFKPDIDSAAAMIGTDVLMPELTRAILPSTGSGGRRPA